MKRILKTLSIVLLLAMAPAGGALADGGWHHGGWHHGGWHHDDDDGGDIGLGLYFGPSWPWGYPPMAPVYPPVVTVPARAVRPVRAKEIAHARLVA